MEKSVYEIIVQESRKMEEKLVDIRRDLHRHPETGWMEMRTSAFIAGELKKAGYKVLTGKDVCSGEDRMGVPERKKLEEHYEMIKNMENEMYTDITEDMKEGYTGVIGILECGKGPVVALRFDIDALPMQEQLSEDHTPYREGFASVYPGAMHACGHDCHAAIGIGTAVVLSAIRKQLHGTVKIIFQPAEEGTRGAYSIVRAGHLDQVDYFLSGHVSSYYEDGEEELIPGSYGALATSKYQVVFHGRAAHAGRVPQEGRNAVVAAAFAAAALTGIERHSEGMSRVNVGSIHGGSAANVVPDQAVMILEVRGETTAVNDYMDQRVREICQGAAAMQGCTCQIILNGQAPSQHSDEALEKKIADVCKKYLPQIRLSSALHVKNQDSEDVGYMMNRVQEQGGEAVYMRLVTPMASPQHTVRFDVDEKVIERAVKVYSTVTADILMSDRKSLKIDKEE